MTAITCTATTRLSADECLARLAACPALPRGERVIVFMRDMARRRVIRSNEKWTPGRYPWWLMSARYAWPNKYDDADYFRRLAAPLRKAREQRQQARRDVEVLRQELARQVLYHAQTIDAATKAIIALANSEDERHGGRP